MRFAAEIFDRIPVYGQGGAERFMVDPNRNRRTKPLLPYEQEIITAPPKY